MRKEFIVACVLIACIGIVSCDDTTDTIGGSLVDNTDKLNVKADTFNVTSNTLLAENIIARTSTGYLGRIEDPETMTTVTGNLMSQFHVLSNYELPAKDSIVSHDTSNQVIADSCDIQLFYSSFYGDSLSQMKLTVYELKKPIEEGHTYYSNFNPEAQGYIRSLNTGGIAEKQSYTLANPTEIDSIRKNKDYVPNITIRLNKQYTDKNGVVYNNYGTFLLRKYLENPVTFRDSYAFLHDICPGFYFKVDDGLGSMAHIQRVQIKNGKSITTSTNLVSTEEVLQMTNFSNDNTRLQQLANETGHTYLKTPAGLFTQLTIPMSDIMAGHRNDSVNSAKIILYRQNNTSESAYHFNIPKNLVMLPSDSLQSFFANNRIPDNKTSFLATYNSTTNSYVFNNISGIVNLFMRHTNSANWGKVVVVPVELQTVTQGTGNNQQTKITKVSHEMGLTSTKLLGNSPGRNNIEISVIYSRFNGR